MCEFLRIDCVNTVQEPCVCMCVRCIKKVNCCHCLKVSCLWEYERERMCKHWLIWIPYVCVCVHACVCVCVSSRLCLCVCPVVCECVRLTQSSVCVLCVGCVAFLSLMFQWASVCSRQLLLFSLWRGLACCAHTHTHTHTHEGRGWRMSVSLFAGVILLLRWVLIYIWNIYWERVRKFSI